MHAFYKATNKMEEDTEHLGIWGIKKQTISK